MARLVGSMGRAFGKISLSTTVNRDLSSAVRHRPLATRPFLLHTSHFPIQLPILPASANPTSSSIHPLLDFPPKRRDMASTASTCHHRRCRLSPLSLHSLTHLTQCATNPTRSCIAERTAQSCMWIRLGHANCQTPSVRVRIPSIQIYLLQVHTKELSRNWCRDYLQRVRLRLRVFESKP
jgi:hypothetical protein